MIKSPQSCMHIPKSILEIWEIPLEGMDSTWHSGDPKWNLGIVAPPHSLHAPKSISQDV